MTFTIKVVTAALSLCLVGLMAWAGLIAFLESL